jgi:hypothetical protein
MNFIVDLGSQPSFWEEIMKKTVSARIGATLTVAFGLQLASAFAADTPKTEDAPELAQYKRTGKYELCLVNNRIKQIQILNRKQILIYMYGSEAYLVEPSYCGGLQKGLAFTYDASLNKLCNTTIVNLVDPGSPVPSRGGCSFDKFEKLDKKPETKANG